MPVDGVVVLVHLAATWFMVGLIWIVQVVHYPLFAAVGAAGFADYEAGHTRRMGAVLVVPWGSETVTALWLAVAPPAGVPVGLPLLGLGLSAVIAALTVTVAVPAHGILRDGFDAPAHRRLVRSNWLRTAAWSARGGIAVAIAALAGVP